MTQEALRMALDALETELSIDWTNNDEFNAAAEKMYEAIAAIKEALAQPEPVATVEDNSQHWKGMDGAIAFHLIERHADNWSDARKMMEEWLSANTPPQRTWVGLTDREMMDAIGLDDTPMESGRKIEQALKEKNSA